MSVAGNVMQRIKEAPTGDGILVERFLSPAEMVKWDQGTTATGAEVSSNNNHPVHQLDASDEVAIPFLVPMDYDDEDNEQFSITFLIANNNATPSTALGIELQRLQVGDTYTAETALTSSLSASSNSTWGAQNILTEVTITVTAGNVARGDLLAFRLVQPGSADVLLLLGAKVRYRSNICATDTSLRLS